MFHERLAHLREKAGLSQQELSARLGMARTTYAGYENGSREPDFKTLDKIAEYFGESVEWLLTGSHNGLSQEDKELISEFSKLNDGDQTYILELIRRLKKE